MQERSIATLEIVREGTLTTESIRAHRQCEVTMLLKDKHKNGKRNLETQITGKKARKLSKKKSKLEKLQEAPEKTSQEANLQKLNLVRIAEPSRMGLRHGEAI
jgi:hypothetical protein